MEVDENTSTVLADVVGEELWFCSYGAKMTASSHGLAALFLLPALKTGAVLCMDGEVEDSAKKRFYQIASIANRWWGFLAKPRLRFHGKIDETVSTAGRTALCFSCGADSFFSLYQNLNDIDDLVIVRGYDVPLDDDVRFEALRVNALAVADALGKRLIVIETNLREHSFFAKVGWKISHGAALAALGHFLSPEIDRLLISASFPTAHIRPWGSSAEMDPLWSSGQLQVLHVGDEVWRAEKLRQISVEPLVQCHLAVCWRGMGVPLNCGKCEKCLRTQLTLLVHDQLHLMEVFPNPDQIVDSLDQLKRVKQEYIVYESFLEKDLPREIKDAIVRLLKRSSRKG